jgi:hypothetical protein
MPGSKVDHPFPYPDGGYVQKYVTREHLGHCVKHAGEWGARRCISAEDVERFEAAAKAAAKMLGFKLKGSARYGVLMGIVSEHFARAYVLAPPGFNDSGIVEIDMPRAYYDGLPVSRVQEDGLDDLKDRWRSAEQAVELANIDALGLPLDNN